MKRIISILFVVIQLICVNSAFSEEYNKPVFEIHNGVQFGMTMEEVIALEAAAGVTLKKINPDKYGWEGLSGEGTVAGQERTSIYYSFIYGKLVQADYVFNARDTFNTLENALIKKYGESDHNYITRERYEKKYFDNVIKTPTHCYIFDDTAEPWSHRIVQISDSLTIAIDHHLNFFSQSQIVYSVLSMGDAEQLSDDALNDL